MTDSYHIIDGQVVPFRGGRKCNDTGAWRDATPLELQLQEQLAESKHVIAAQAAEIEALQAEIERLAEAVRGWWEEHRPIGWTEDQHRSCPHVNLATDAEKALVTALLRYQEEDHENTARAALSKETNHD